MSITRGQELCLGPLARPEVLAKDQLTVLELHT